jgi:NADH-dependent peroxiredoxin subunit F
MIYDLIIIGGGPAGMTAAVYAARKKISFLLISKDFGGQANLTGGIENYMGYQFVEGPELMKKFEDQVKQFSINMKIGEPAKKVVRTDDGFIVSTDNETFQSKTLIIASGKRPRRLNVPGEDKFLGRGVTYCAICDGPLFSDMDVAIIGGGNSALEAVQDMLKIANHVYLVSLTKLTADLILVDRIKSSGKVTIFTEYEILEIGGRKFVDSLRIKNRQTGKETSFSIAGIFIEIGLIPNSDFVEGIVELNDCSEIKVNCSNEVNIPGIFAAGDVTSVPEKQIVVAAGEGAKAALSANRYLQRLQEKTL